MISVCDGLRFPEGPVALPGGEFLVVEIEARRITKIGANGSKTTVASFTGGPNGLAIGPDGKCYVCNNGGLTWTEDANGLRPGGEPADYAGGRIERVDLATGEVETLYTETANGPLRGPNDIVFDRNGGFWFTDYGKARARDMDRGGVYYAAADGSSIREVIYPMLTPNGIGLSPEEDRLYVAETITGRVWSFDLAGPGEIARQPWPPCGGRLLYTAPNYRLFDSLAVDGEGNVCVGALYPGGISVISPEGGLVEHIELPDLMVTNLCFAGPDMRKAYVTASCTGRLLEIDWPRPGLAMNFVGAA